MSEATDSHGTAIRDEFAQRLLGEAPATVESFVVGGEGGERLLALRNSLHRWRVPS
jgi:hypothetical protein